MNQRQLFLQHVAQTSPAPLALEMVKAKGTRIWDKEGNEWLDLIAGISVCNIGHRHPKVVKAIKSQADQYLHLLVYGEMVETPQVQYASLLAEKMPGELDSVYFTNSGAEATEGAMKLAKRSTGRTVMAAFSHSYHGSTQGALSLIGDEYWRNAFRPLLPQVHHLEYNSFEDLQRIDHTVACVFVEPVQAEKGVIIAAAEWFLALRERCTETGALLVIDCIQTGFGRTGSLWGFEQYHIIPDIVLLGKALGGGMPLGAFMAPRELMSCLTEHPVLGHITTFGGHPVCCAAGLAAFQVLLKKELHAEVEKKAALFRRHLDHPAIKSVRTAGLLISVEFENWSANKKVIDYCLHHHLLTDWFLFAPECLRIAPPLTITRKEIRRACKLIVEGASLI